MYFQAHADIFIVEEREAHHQGHGIHCNFVGYRRTGRWNVEFSGEEPETVVGFSSKEAAETFVNDVLEGNGTFYPGCAYTQEGVKRRVPGLLSVHWGLGEHPGKQLQDAQSAPVP